jgi:hypothetical protein
MYTTFVQFFLKLTILRVIVRIGGMSRGSGSADQRNSVHAVVEFGVFGLRRHSTLHAEVDEIQQTG